MAGIQGIAGVPEPNRSGRTTSTREQAKAQSAHDESSSSDGVAISGEAQAAAALTESLRVANTQPDIRADRVAAAKLAIERGDYKKPEIVEAVAERISKYL